MMSLVIKAAFGAALVVVIDALSKTPNFYFAGLIILFPWFSVVTHYLIFTERGANDLRQTIAFGVASIIPYLIYMVVIYLAAARLRIVPALLLAVFCWGLAALALTRMWKH